MLKGNLVLKTDMIWFNSRFHVVWCIVSLYEQKMENWPHFEFYDIPVLRVHRVASGDKKWEI